MLPFFLGDQNLQTVDGQEQVFNISTIIVHPRYNTITYDNDVALVNIETNANLTNFVNTICLPDDVSMPGIRCTIAGWGATMEHGRASNNLIKAEVPIIDGRTCARADIYGSKITGNMICAGYANGGIDTCQGDSGGPLHCRDKDNPSSWEIQGIASWGRGCGRQLRFGVYTKVHNFVQWINCIMKNSDAVLKSKKTADARTVCAENPNVANVTSVQKIQSTTYYTSEAQDSRFHMEITVTASKYNNHLKSGLFLTPTSTYLHHGGQNSIQSSEYSTSFVKNTSATSIYTCFQTRTDSRSMSLGARQSWPSLSNNAAKQTGVLRNSEIRPSTKTGTAPESTRQLSSMSSRLVMISRKESLGGFVDTPVSSVINKSSGIFPALETGSTGKLTKQTLTESRATSSTTMSLHILPSDLVVSTTVRQHGILVQTEKQYSVANGSFVLASMLVDGSHTNNFSIGHTDLQNRTMALAQQTATNTPIKIESSIEVTSNGNVRTNIPNARSNGSIHCSFALLLFALSILSMYY